MCLKLLCANSLHRYVRMLELVACTECCASFFSFVFVCVWMQAWSWRCEGTEAGTDNSACPLGGDNRETGEAVVPCDLRKDKSRDRSRRVGAHQSGKTALMPHHNYSSVLPVLIDEVFTNWCYWANRLTCVCTSVTGPMSSALCQTRMYSILMLTAVLLTASCVSSLRAVLQYFGHHIHQTKVIRTVLLYHIKDILL